MKPEKSTDEPRLPTDEETDTPVYPDGSVKNECWKSPAPVRRTGGKIKVRNPFRYRSEDTADETER